MFSTRFDTGYVTLETSDLDLRVRENIHNKKCIKLIWKKYPSLTRRLQQNLIFYRENI